MCLTDLKHDRFGVEGAQRKSITLSERDLEDARRLFGLLAEADRPGERSDLPHILYERLQSASGRLQHKARQILALRERRAKTFGKAMFGEPAWDILLVLYTAGGGLTMNRLAQLAGVSQATGLRWMNYLADRMLIERAAHPTDARSSVVKLTEKGNASLEAFLSAAVELSGS